MLEEIIYFLASLIAVIFVFAPHEYAHAFVAYKNGDPTAKMRGRLTLNPFKHIDPMGYVLCALVGFGWAKPVPVEPGNFRSYKKGMFTTAIAGVIVNYIIAFIAYLLYALVYAFFIPKSTFAVYICYFLECIFYLIFAYSLYSFVFNLLPLYPLDGFRVVEATTRQINPVQKFLRNYGQLILIILIIESFICDFIIGYIPGTRAATIVGYFDILGYVGWFAENIIGFPITAAWGWILKL
ncbi:MAG: site-2 protease family protein [Clostridiales bacterium]|nr:site-2 protease family protein [Clostridiales bacterium]